MIVVTGASGFVGRHLVADLRDRGADVRALVRPGPGREGQPAARLDHAEDWPRVLEGADAVVHLAAHNPSPFARRGPEGTAAFRRVNVDGTALVAGQAARAGVRRFVLMSSIRVYGRWEGAAFEETSPLRADDPYGKSKREAERAVVETLDGTATAWTMLRPPMIYGAGGGGLAALIARAVRAGVPVPVDDGVRRSLIFVGNAVAAVNACLVDVAAAGRIFNICDGPALGYREMVDGIAAAVGRPARIFRFPSVAVEAAGRLPGVGSPARRLFTSSVCDDGLIRRTLDWTPPATTAEGFRRAFAPD